jgi:hypothetical protein
VGGAADEGRASPANGSAIASKALMSVISRNFTVRF